MRFISIIFNLVKNNQKKIFGLIIFFLPIIFYYPILKPNYFIDGGDIKSLHLPAVYYLSEKLSEREFPFWSERIYLGFPVYANSEFGFFSPLRIIFTLLFAPLTVLKLEFLVFLLIGSFSLYFLIIKYKVLPFYSLVGVIIYFFSFPIVTRILHLNIIYCVFLTPFNILLYTKFKENNKALYIFIRSLVFFILFTYGNPNGIFLALVPEILYIIFDNKFRLIKKITYIFLSYILGIILALPILFSTYNIYLKSARNNIGIDFTEGSYSLLTLLNGIYPYSLGTFKNYIGEMADSRLFLNETLFYISITGITISVVSIIIYKNTFTKLFLSSMYIFLILSTLKVSGLSNFFDIPPINLFRYWGRSAIFLLLPVSLCVSYFLNSYNTNKFKFKNFKSILYLLPAFFYLGYLYFYKNLSYADEVIINALNSGLLITDPYIGLWKRLLIVFLFILVIHMFYNKKNIKKYTSIIIGVIISIDVLYLSFSYLSNVNYNYTNFFDKNLYNGLITSKNKRSVYLSKEIIGNKPLMYPVWSPFGYSVSYEFLEYKNLFDTKNLSIRRLGPKDNLYQNKEFFKSIGVYQYIDGYEIINFNDNIDKKNNLEYLIKKEGYIKAKIISHTNKTFETNIINYNGWVVYINDEKIKPVSLKDDLFLKIPINAGENLIEFKFIPIDFYYGIFASIFGILMYIPILKVVQKKVYEKS